MGMDVGPSGRRNGKTNRDRNVPGASWSIVTETRGQYQPADGSRTLQVLTADEPFEPRPRRSPAFSTPPSLSKHSSRRQRPTSADKSR
jgi:hypothetical protein